MQNSRKAIVIGLVAAIVLAAIGSLALYGELTVSAQTGTFTPPTNVAATSSGDTITVSWMPGSGASSQVIVAVNVLDDTDYCLGFDATGSASTHECPGLNSGKTYVVLVIALDGQGGYEIGRDSQGNLVTHTVSPESTASSPQIALSDVDNRRGYELTVIGRGFNPGAYATVYVLHTDNAPSSCQSLVDHPDSVAYGRNKVGIDTLVAVTFAVASPPFREGQNNFICMVDSDGRTAGEIERFELEPPPAPIAATCTGDDYDRSEWGTYPGVPTGAAAKWTLASDNVNNTSLTHDHHVALKDAHVSGGCDWTATRKDALSSDADNLNPTTGSFNSSKGSRTPDMLTGIAEGIINTAPEKCDYATQHRDVKAEYELTMTTAEQATVDTWLALCN